MQSGKKKKDANGAENKAGTTEVCYFNNEAPGAITFSNKCNTKSSYTAV